MGPVAAGATGPTPGAHPALGPAPGAKSARMTRDTEPARGEQSYVHRGWPPSEDKSKTGAGPAAPDGVSDTNTLSQSLIHEQKPALGE